MFAIGLTPEATADLDSLRNYDRKRILDAIYGQLPHQAITEARNRRRLRPNPFAQWELRVGSFRVFYDVDEENEQVKVLAVGYKEGNQLYVHGEEYEL